MSTAVVISIATVNPMVASLVGMRERNQRRGKPASVDTKSTQNTGSRVFMPLPRYAKDILPYVNGPHPDVNLIRLARAPFFVPESKGVVSLLQDFKDRRTSVAIVVDEFGGTAGLVTLEDVVEEILGELRDPFDLEEAEVKPLGRDEFLVDARVPLDDLGDRLPHVFPDDRDYDTLGGFLFDRFDKIPSVGQWISDGGRRFTIKTLEGNRIAKVRISALNAEAEDDTHEN